ncbi:phage/plasmid replication protein, II/X family [Pseudomonas aeruginosa]|uniref:phage/plasmid replication protein, II/X family n=1 Tax=Pseudomonas aeruginosa TaxID=287 RepID=UPI003AF35A6E
MKVLKRESRCGMPQVSAARTLKVLKDPRLLAFADNLLRLEATVMHRWLERREIPTNLWALCDYQEALEARGVVSFRSVGAQSPANCSRP